MDAIYLHGDGERKVWVKDVRRKPLQTRRRPWSERDGIKFVFVFDCVLHVQMNGMYVRSRYSNVRDELRVPVLTVKATPPCSRE